MDNGNDLFTHIPCLEISDDENMIPNNSGLMLNVQSDPHLPILLP